jgi:hypothetical protein
MTEDGIRETERWVRLHFELGGIPDDPKVAALVTLTNESIGEVLRLRGVVREAASYLNDLKSDKAARIEAQIDWTATTPGL